MEGMGPENHKKTHGMQNTEYRNTENSCSKILLNKITIVPVLGFYYFDGGKTITLSPSLTQAKLLPASQRKGK